MADEAAVEPVDFDEGAEPSRVRFFGRQRELKALRADIEVAGLDTIAGRKAPHPRVLLIAGRPGSGRTTLAGELVRRLTAGGEYGDGVLSARLTEIGRAHV